MPRDYRSKSINYRKKFWEDLKSSNWEQNTLDAAFLAIVEGRAPSDIQNRRSVKPREKKPEFVYRIIDSEGKAVGSYSRAYCDEFDFNSAFEARNANCHGLFRDKVKYKIAKYRVTYELIDPDCDT